MRPMGRRLVTLDCSAVSAVAACPCGWREGPFLDRTGARRARDRHLVEAHPKQAADAAYVRRRRRAG